MVCDTDGVRTLRPPENIHKLKFGFSKRNRGHGLVRIVAPSITRWAPEAIVQDATEVLEPAAGQTLRVPGDLGRGRGRGGGATAPWLQMPTEE